MEFYKVCILDKEGNPTKTYEFNGEYAVFNSASLHVPIQIHKDDTVLNIKKKIITALENTVSYDEIFMFIKTTTITSTKQIFDSVFKQGNTIDNIIFSQLLQNIGYDILEKPIPNKQKYTYQDFLTLVNDDPKQSISSIGLQFTQNKDESFPMNPYLLNPEFSYIGSSDNRLVNMENSLLYSAIGSNKMTNNIIYICLAENIFELFERKGISNDFIPNYFPHLFKKNILSISTLIKEKQSLLKESKKLLDPKTLQIFENIDILYDIYRENSQKTLPYIKRGIYSIDLCIHPEEQIQLPLDTIFKTVHASQITPFIKYNPGSRRENIYRLYSTRINKYGAKIPDLNRPKIFQLSKELREIGKTGQITFYLPFSKSIDIIITITSIANVYINIILENPIEIEELNNILRDSVNPILSMIPYPLPQFNSLFSNYCEIIKINYKLLLPIKRKFTIFKEGYISSIFQVIEENILNGAVMKFRRVNNFEEMTPESALIVDWFNSSIEKGNLDKEDLIRQLMDFSSIDKDQALLKMNVFLRDHTIINGKYNNSSENIVENAGFLTRFSINNTDDTVLVEIDNINSVFYIETIGIYLDSILRMKQYPETLTINKDRIIKAIKHITNVKQTEKSHIENVTIVGKVNLIEALSFGKTKFINSSEFDEDEQDNVFEDFEDDDQENKEENKEENKNFFENLEDYEDAVFEDADFEILDTPESNEEKSLEKQESPHSELPEVSKEAMTDIDESDDDSDDEGIVFGGNIDNCSMRFPYEIIGGSQSDEYERELDGKPLKTGNDNIILTRLKKKEPQLFLSKDAENGFFDRYSRLCPAYRQPVILSEEEKKKIDDKDAIQESKYNDKEKSYSEAIQYGTDPKKLNWYICPRYWCLKTNTSLTQQEVDSRVCGGIIEPGSKKIQSGDYVLEFKKGTQHLNRDGSYHNNKPGFLIKDNHPDGYCLPCCFKEWSKPQQDKQDQCIRQIEPKQKTITVNKSQMILKVEAMPLDHTRYGFLPLSIQRFFGISHQSAVQPDNPSVLKSDGETMLRVGVQQNSRKSFLGCIADLYSRKRKKQVSINKLCEIIVDAVTIDIFIRVNNGALPAVFKHTYNSGLTDDQEEESMFKKSLDLKNDTQLRFYNETLSAYYAFRKFLLDDNSIIDYTYLWDIICLPNAKLFETGLNLAILDITQNDSTDNVALLCPSAAYSKTYYDTKKETMIILKAGTIFEPIYLVNTRQIIPTFMEEYIESENLKQVLNIIRYSAQNYCAPLQSIPQYEFKRNRLAEEVYLNLLKKTDIKPLYTITNQIQSYQGKTIGFKVTLPEDGGFIFIPCLPSSILPGIPIKYIDSDYLWLPYEKTRDLLFHVKEQSEGKILCQPIFKVIEDGVIVGIITETNQFVQIDQPTENIFEDNLREMKSNNYILADRNISTGKQDMERIRSVKKIELESQFYSAFRSFIRLLLQQPKNKEKKLNILKYIENRKGKYNRIYCLRKIGEILKDLTGVRDDLARSGESTAKIQFYEYNDDDLFELSEINNCQDNTDEEKSYCFSIVNPIDKIERGLLIPKKHLISGKENKEIYFGRLSDELLRYRRVQPYLLHELNNSNIKIFNIRNIEYKLNKDEMILLQSFLTKEYFEELTPFSQNDSVNITYEYAHEDPRISQKYSDLVEYAKQRNLAEGIKESELDIICVNSTVKVAGNPATSIWKQMLPDTSNEIILNTNRECSFYPIIYIMREIYKREFNIYRVRETLRNSYKKYFDYFDKILMLFKKQGKKEIVKKILLQKDIVIQQSVFEEFILSESYFLSDIDIWILAQELSLPIILFTSTTLKNLLDSVSWLVTGKNEKTDKFYFIRSYSSIKADEYHDYHMILPPVKLSELKFFKSKDGRMYLKDMIQQGYSGDKSYMDNVISLKDYFEKFSFVKPAK